jgi:hypothetical protein
MREHKTRARSLWPKQQRGDGSRIPDLDPQLLRANDCHLIRPVFGFLAHPAGFFRGSNLEMAAISSVRIRSTTLPMKRVTIVMVVSCLSPESTNHACELATRRKMWRLHLL